MAAQAITARVIAERECRAVGQRRLRRGAAARSAGVRREARCSSAFGTDRRSRSTPQRLTRLGGAGKTARMATLTQQEFAQTVTCLADDLGLQRLRDKLVRLNALVTRRRVASAQALSDQLYTLTGGLRRQVAATIALQSLWSEQMNQRLGEDGEKSLEELADKINACLGERETINAEKETELDGLLDQYESRLAEKVGPERARLDMLLKAVPAVAAKLRAKPLGGAASAAPEQQTEG